MEFFPFTKLLLLCALLGYFMVSQWKLASVFCSRLKPGSYFNYKYRTMQLALLIKWA